MKLLWLSVTIAIVSARPAVDVEKTVQNVQSILQANSYLPRLTRQEIIDLLNDISKEDAKSTSVPAKQVTTEKTTTTPYSNDENEINSVSELPKTVSVSVNDQNSTPKPTRPTYESTTKIAEPTLMVVLPYTPRDGVSLQELYTKPPRTEVVPVPKTTPKPAKVIKSENLKNTLTNNHKLANKHESTVDTLSAELQAFLDAHGLKDNPSKDHFLLPLDGFKPLPAATVVDGSVQLPENILLTYDLIEPSVESNSSDVNQIQNNYIYEPLRPELPFELDTSESESQKTVLPLDLPKSRKPKSSNSEPALNFEPIDYDSIKVIPLKQGPSPVQDEKLTLDNDQNKRQVSTEASSEVTTTAAPDVKEESPAVDSAAAADSGASITDLEDSFGGAAPEIPGDSELPPPRKNGFYWMLDWNSFLEVGDGDTKVNIRFEPKLGDPQMFLPVNVP